MPTKKRTSRSATAKAEKERAKRIILEIVRQNGGAFSQKTNLYKAFYHAHLRFAEQSPGYLSEWPIVRMPNGPGIDDAKTLLYELVSDGYLKIDDCGEYEGFSFALTEKADTLPPLSDDELAAIRYGVRCVAGKTAKKVSAETHAKSRSWRNAKEGEELNIYADISDEKRHRQRVQFFRRVGPLMEKALKS